MVVVDMREQRIDFYDPGGSDGARICEAIRLWLCDMHQGLRTGREGRRRRNRAGSLIVINLNYRAFF